MAVHKAYKDSILQAWQDYIAGENKTQSIRPQIVDSWQRCVKAGVNPYNNSLHQAMDSFALDKKMKETETLIHIAKPFMANLHKFVEGSGFVVVLTDENGYILEMFCDEHMRHNPLSRNFFPGANWHEKEAGTNAIGTALELRQPLQVSGAEHYCQKHHCLTCSSAPLFDTNGQLIGVLDLSGASHASHQHTLGMVVAAAEAITAQLSVYCKNHELALVNNRLTNFFNAVSDGVIIIDKHRKIIEVNPAAIALLGISDKEVLGTSVHRLLEPRAVSDWEILATYGPYSDVELMVGTNEGLCHCLATAEPVTDALGSVTGSILILRPIKQVRNLVNRFSGYSATFQFSDIIGESDEIRDMVHLALLSTTTNSNILLQGESGTGKEIFAQAIHNHGKRHAGPFIAVNCGAIPRELIGSELFGYEEGAFTGAKRGGKLGKFELASGGTLFLDEIGDMPLEQQIALLRVIQEKKVARIGGDRMIPVNVRLICATNKNLLQEVEKGTFRQDLYYRLNVMTITLPPLRSHVADIPLLFNHFLEKLGRDWGSKFRTNQELLEVLKNYSWPGNVRELQNVVERAASLAEDGFITLRHLPAGVLSPMKKNKLDLTEVLPNQTLDNRSERQRVAKDGERQMILGLLDRYAGNVSQVAREMSVSRKTLYNKMRIYSIQN